MGRRDWPQYDPAAIFEAVVNDVAHRDYSIRGAKVRLRMFSDRIELSSPGMLMNGMTVADLPYKQQVNPSIANLLDRCPIPEGLETPRLTLMDRRGEGVAGGSTFPEISKKVFRPLPVIVPSEQVLAAYEDLVCPLYHRIVANTKECVALVQARDLLLPRLITGEIRATTR